MGPVYSELLAETDVCVLSAVLQEAFYDSFELCAGLVFCVRTPSELKSKRTRLHEYPNSHAFQWESLVKIRSLKIFVISPGDKKVAKDLLIFSGIQTLTK